MKTWFLLLLLCVLSEGVHAQVFKCEVDGRTAFQDRPCAGVAERDMEIIHLPGTHDEFIRKSGTDLDGRHMKCSEDKLSEGFSRPLENFNVLFVCGIPSGVTREKVLSLEPGGETLEKSPQAGMKF